MDDLDDLVRVNDAHGVRTIVLARPRARNAMTLAMRERFCRLLADAERDPGVRVVIVTGEDPAFSAGVDFKEQPASPVDPLEVQFRPNPGKALRAMRTPVICAVNGVCVSGGLEIALSAAFIIASDRARFADTHARLGVVASWGLTALLPRAVGVRRAREMSITGNFIDADEALRVGLVNRVVRHDDLLPACKQLAEEIADTGAVGEVMALYERGVDLSLSAALALEAAHVAGRSFDPAAFAAAGERTARRGSSAQ